MEKGKHVLCVQILFFIFKYKSKLSTNDSAKSSRQLMRNLFSSKHQGPLYLFLDSMPHSFKSVFMISCTSSKRAFPFHACRIDSHRVGYHPVVSQRLKGIFHLRLSSLYIYIYIYCYGFLDFIKSLGGNENLNLKIIQIDSPLRSHCARQVS